MAYMTFGRFVVPVISISMVPTVRCQIMLFGTIPALVPVAGPGLGPIAGGPFAGPAAPGRGVPDREEGEGEGDDPIAVTVGETVGDTVDETVGDNVGVTVGVTVGDTVGDTVDEGDAVQGDPLVTVDGGPDLDLGLDDDDENDPDLSYETPGYFNWKSLGYVPCLLCNSNKKKNKFYKKSLMVKHYNYLHKNISSGKSFTCTKCGQVVKEGHKCSVPRGYQFN